MLQRFDLERCVWECNGFVSKLKNSNVLRIKFTYPGAVLYYLLFACSLGQFNAISASYRYLGVPLLKERQGRTLLSAASATRSE